MNAGSGRGKVRKAGYGGFNILGVFFDITQKTESFRKNSKELYSSLSYGTRDWKRLRRNRMDRTRDNSVIKSKQVK